MQITGRIATLVLIAALIAGPSPGLAQRPAASSEAAAAAAAPVNDAPSADAAKPLAAEAATLDRPETPVPNPSSSSAAASPEPQSQSQSQTRTDLPHDLSPWGMFMSADWVVKAVMIGLAFASLMTWTVCLGKTVEVVCARARATRAFRVITASESLADAGHRLVNRGGPAAFMVRSAGEELRRSARVLDHASDGGVKERVVSRLARIEAQAGRRLTRGTGLLATIGATAPFVGLFGTVWGIMNAFIGISQSQTTNLAVVAPGIAEALLTTAFGLVAAIPAVVIYNVFARAVTGYRQHLADAAAGIEQLVSLDLDARKVPGTRTASASVLAAE
jgi:biopolymer transport protein ExbB